MLYIVWQTDYFCTLCESYLKEEELQSHLFEGHQAENVEESFVRVKSTKGQEQGQVLHICVVCWAKIPNRGGQQQQDDLRVHREGCRTDPGEEDLENGSVPMDGKVNTAAASVANVISTPSITSMLTSSASSSDGALNGGAFMGTPSLSLTPLGPSGKSRGGTTPRKRSSQPPPVVPSSTTSHLVNGLAAAAAAAGAGGGGVLAAAAQQQSMLAAAGLAAAQQRMQCSLCSMVVPSPGYLVHLRDFHRVTCPLEDLTCPLCMSSVPVLELSLHLTAVHSAAPLAAVNSIMVNITLVVESSSVC